MVQCLWINWLVLRKHTVRQGESPSVDRGDEKEGGGGETVFGSPTGIEEWCILEMREGNVCVCEHLAE